MQVITVYVIRLKTVEAALKSLPDSCPGCNLWRPLCEFERSYGFPGERPPSQENLRGVHEIGRLTNIIDSECPKAGCPRVATSVAFGRIDDPKAQLVGPVQQRVGCIGSDSATESDRAEP